MSRTVPAHIQSDMIACRRFAFVDMTNALLSYVSITAM